MHQPVRKIHTDALLYSRWNAFCAGPPGSERDQGSCCYCRIAAPRRARTRLRFGPGSRETGPLSASWNDRENTSSGGNSSVGDQNRIQREVLEGYVVDQACLRKYPQAELLVRARAHTVKCALMGHCVESGYGLVDDQGRPFLLEPAATPGVVEAIRNSGQQRGIRIRATREMHGGSMRTVEVTALG